ncbi:hypothetical protein BFW01_g125 [Lasiodiplodia theobromae]|uniref:DUF3074 domain-containing protein n=1 Tax=Lasiodiplodia theobromae TaxID=45133 RepID=A0A8H7IQT1_9PEZI|nr:uncharacterized protein LTHEOB_2800 [Lasiodiplodia theobromae]KAF4534825.1 hypothetical protein LTHEOB_2800 [Lasiodiplodia theobromae]KAF9629944.1 hypothetical protein BFW01_g125 [Lasiodiplodia theobromae]
MSQPTPGDLVRLRILTTTDLPPHPSIKPTSPHNVDLFNFLQTVLDEGVAFADEYVPQTFNKGRVKESPPAVAKVHQLSRDIKVGSDGKTTTESWFARESVHQNVSEQGTATFAEFDNGLRVEHSKHEMEYTPSVFDAHRVADWNELIAVRGGNVPGGYEEVTMSVYEMCHQMPPPLTNRVFPVVVVTAKTSPDSFVVVQIPVDLTDFPDGDVLYANGRNKRDADPGLTRKKITRGMYVSVERVKIMETGDVKWMMATASDAKGYLPMIVQKQGVPGAVLKDVGLFIKWTMDKRSSGEAAQT